VALGQVFSENFDFLCQSTFHLLLYNHLHYHPRLAQYARSGRSANSLTIQNYKKTVIFSVRSLLLGIVKIYAFARLSVFKALSFPS
jgi:hypothetical protein